MKVIDGVKLTDETIQKAEWRARTMADILNSDYDFDTRYELIEAALSQARSEGILDSAYVCERVSSLASDARAKWVADVMAKSLREMDKRDREKKISVVGKEGN